MLNKQVALLDEFEEARASLEKVGALFDEITTTIAQAHKQRNFLRLILNEKKQMRLNCKGN